MPGEGRRARIPELSDTAVELAKIAEQMLGELAVGTGDVSTQIDSIVERLTEFGRVGLLKQLFQGLPIAEQYQILADTFGDEELMGALAEQRRLANENARLQTVMDRLRFDATHHQFLDTRSMISGLRMQVDLHDIEDFSGAGNYDDLMDGSFDADWLIVVNAVGNGTFRVLGNEIVNVEGQKRRKPSVRLKPHQIITLGSPQSSTDYTLIPRLHWEAPVWVAMEDGTTMALRFSEVELALGGIWVNNSPIFTNKA
jgi:hypothetical protein